MYQRVPAKAEKGQKGRTPILKPDVKLRSFTFAFKLDHTTPSNDHKELLHVFWHAYKLEDLFSESG